MKILPLHEGWRVSRAGENAWLPATVPGQVHLDLLAAGKLDDPFVGDREKQSAWVGESDWEYELRFAAPLRIRGKRRVRLVFDGLDTFATVRLNGDIIIEANNMFRPWCADVKRLLRPTDNHLSVRFRSAPGEIRPRLDGLPYRLPCSHDHSGGTRPYARKAQYQYGWDWGPYLVTCGIWRGVRLEAWNHARIVEMAVVQRNVTSARADVDVDLTVETEEEGPSYVRLLIDGQEFASSSELLSAGAQHVNLACVLPNPRRWWPAGYGEQALYRFRVELRTRDELTAVERRVGLRTLEVQRTADAEGESFGLLVNGTPLFAKGVNWIPADSFTARVDASRYRRLLGDARAANMNMVRVWGGGIYEEDRFYDLCDEFGLLVWQDFMFACALYPADEAFLESVREEAEHQVGRLRHHPSLALWCGNNENEWALSDWGWKDQAPASALDDYRKLFDDVLPGVCRRLDPGRLYWPSSPASAVRTTGRANDPSRGDMHCWEVWGEAKALPERYLLHRPRFASEFGFQAFPDPQTVAAYAPAGERAPGSAVMLAHQKAPQGNEKILAHVARMFGEARDEDSFFRLSQMVQAEAIRVGVEHFRRLRPHCMGALYWQLDDCWPAASWSSIDYFGRWKALHYAAARFFAPLLVSLSAREGRVSVHVVSDLPDPMPARLVLRALDVEGAELWRQVIEMQVTPLASTEVAVIDLQDLGARFDPARCFLHAQLRQGRRSLTSQCLYFAEARALPRLAPGLQARWVRRGREAAVAVSTQRLARGVMLETDAAGRFADNFFDLIPGEKRRVRFRSCERCAVGDAATLSVRFLDDLLA